MNPEVQVVDGFELARTGSAVEGRVPIRELHRLSAELADMSGAIEYRFACHVDRLGRPAATLALSGRLVLRCDRCGEKVDMRLDRNTAFFFVHDEEELTALPVTVEDEPEPLLGSSQFDLVALVEDEAILAIPLSPRHDKCPAKEGESDRPGVAGAPKPFAGLQRLLRKNGR